MAALGISEYDIEMATLAWLEGISWQIAQGPDIAPDAPSAERTDYEMVVLERRLRDALAALNPGLPADALDDAYQKLTRPLDRCWRPATAHSTICS